ncbi:CBS domain-containing protein [Streptomyces sp. NPDC054841]
MSCCCRRGCRSALSTSPTTTRRRQVPPGAPARRLPRGVSSMQIQYMMNTPPACVPGTESLENAARHMADTGVGALPVVDGDRVIGVVTDRDLVVRAMARGRSPQTPVKEVMSTDPVTVEADTAVAVAILIMRSVQVRHLPVVAEGRLIGMIAFDDLFWQLTQELSDLAAVVDAARKVPQVFHGTEKAPLLDG